MGELVINSTYIWHLYWFILLLIVDTSCSDNGTVVIRSLGPEEDKETVIHRSEPIKSVCVENDTSPKKDRSFIFGKFRADVLPVGSISLN